MLRMRIRFRTAGLQTTLQDFGRSGYQHLGVPSGGAMDRFSAAIANRLVGNRDEAPVFEMALMGPSVEFTGDCRISITGADLSPSVNGCSVPMWETLTVKANATLTFGARRSGCRSYLAIAGSVRSPKWLGSVSPAQLGSGGAVPASSVVAGQAFEVATRRLTEPKKVFAVGRRPDLPIAGKTHVLPILRGPEWDWFSPEQHLAFLATEFSIGSASNRMGYRLNSFWNQSMSLPPMISSGVTPGVIQVAASGQPMLLMRDSQTTGGYPRIAVVKYESIDMAGQLSPGDRVGFSL